MAERRSSSTLPNCVGRQSRSSSKKKIIKAYFLGGYATEDDYLLLLEAIEDRNRLSHIYDAETFGAILARLPGYAALFESGRRTRIMTHHTRAARRNEEALAWKDHLLSEAQRIAHIGS